MMKRVNDTATLLTAINKQKIEELCTIIHDNCENPIGWKQLTMLSGFTHTELIALFQFYKQNTPMAYIKNARRLKMINSPVMPHEQLFSNLLKTKSETT